MNMQIRWHGHACFSVTCEGYNVVFDPYQDGSVPGFPPLVLEADLVLCSHEHHDHNARENVRLRAGRACPFTVTELHTFHDDCGGAKRGPNTIRILESGGLRLAHLGDLGVATLPPEQEAALQNLDAVLIPVGGFFTIGPDEAKSLLDRIRPRVTIPMHFRAGKTGLPMIAELDSFLKLAGPCVRCTEPVFELSRQTPPQLAVLPLSR